MDDAWRELICMISGEKIREISFEWKQRSDLFQAETYSYE